MQDRSQQPGETPESALSHALDAVDGVIARIPVPLLRDRVRASTRELRELLVESRMPRVALVGRRGAGKSSLVNALLGDRVATVGHVQAETMTNTWRTFGDEHAGIRLLDTRGLQEGTLDGQGTEVEKDPALDELRRAFTESPPDLVLFVVKAKEADAGIDGDLARLRRLVKVLNGMGVEKVPVIGVITQCDEVEPPDVRLHAPDDEDDEEVEAKTGRIREAARMLESRLKRLEGVHVVDVLGTCAYMRWRQDGSLHRDFRWNVDRLQNKLLHELPTTAVYKFVQLARIQRLKLEMARKLVNAFAVICGGIGALPLPIADTIPLLMLQGAMVLSIAKLASPLNTPADVTRFLGVLGLSGLAGFAAREVFRGLVQLVPFLGTATSVVVAWAGTKAIGEAAIGFFIRKQDEATVRAQFTQNMKRFRAEAEEDANLQAGSR